MCFFCTASSETTCPFSSILVSHPFAIALSLVSRRLDFTPKQEQVQQVESLENEKNVAGQTKHNFHYNLWEMEKGGAKTRYQWNMDAIRTLKQIESENRLATPEEQKTLSKFVGWGGLSQAFDCHLDANHQIHQLTLVRHYLTQYDHSRQSW